MALGATRANILRLIANDGLRMVVVGLALGLGTGSGGVAHTEGPAVSGQRI
jgi:hypothetical protein